MILIEPFSSSDETLMQIWFIIYMFCPLNDELQFFWKVGFYQYLTSLKSVNDIIIVSVENTLHLNYKLLSNSDYSYP